MLISSLKININQDGGTANPTIAKDVMAFSLGYYNGDYKAIGGSSANAFALTYQSQPADFTGKNLYNGNIGNMTVALSKFRNGDPVGYTYRYDQLNRLTAMRQHNLNGGMPSWDSGSITNNYLENYTYDANGNILNLTRNGQNGQVIDQLAYNYNKTDGKLTDNKLVALSDAAGVTEGNDAGSSNYGYDAIGNMTSDSQAGINNMQWSVYGKLKGISKSNGQNITYNYDAAGNRVQKNVGGISTYYLRDAQGNTLGVYNNQNGTINWKEQHLYGSSRLGTWNPDINLSNGNASISWDTIGKKQYELSNHLGNVMATITDRRLQNGNLYEADVLSMQDYYSFGQSQKGRTFGITNRYSFNGKEDDVESGLQDYGMRMYDKRTSRFISVDPITKQYPELTPYQFASNRPIDGIDMDGLEFAKAIPTQAWSANGIRQPYNNVEAKQWWNEFLLMYGKAYASVVATVTPVEELAAIGLAEIGIRIPPLLRAANAIKIESKIARSASNEIKAVENTGNIVGAEREKLAAELSGGTVAKVGKKDLTISIQTKQGKVSASVDVIGANGELVTVGGAAKAKNLGGWGDHLKRLKQVADAKNVKAQAYLDPNTPKEVVSLSEKFLGKENVKTLTKK